MRDYHAPQGGKLNFGVNEPIGKQTPLYLNRRPNTSYVKSQAA